jgi:hypothetical protein
MLFNETMLGTVQLWFKKIINMVVYDRLKNFGKVVENRYGSIVLNRRSFPLKKNNNNNNNNNSILL